MRVGVARTDITPPIGIELSGFVARMSPSTSVDNPLYARALVIESAGTAAAIVSLDLLAIGQASYTELKGL